MAQTSDPVLVYMVSWHFSTGDEFSYTVSMKESQARLIEELLEKYVESGYLLGSDVEEISEPLSSQQLMKIIKEEFPRTRKDWMP